MSTAFFADMDATTIYSKRHITSRESGYTGLVVVETYNGEPLSFMTFDAVKALSALSRRLAFVPTTTRDRAQFDRIEIPDVRSRYAIVANGGRILVDGVEDRSWTEEVERVVSASAPASDVLAEMQATLRNEPWLHLVRSSSDLFAYVVAKPGESAPEWFREFLESRAPEWRFTLSVQGRTTYLIPAGLTKERAAAEVAARIGADVVFASGDSLLDVGLMRFATHAIQPRHGELNTCVTDLPRTEKSGLDAGQEILDFVTSRLDAACG